MRAMAPASTRAPVDAPLRPPSAPSGPGDDAEDARDRETGAEEDEALRARGDPDVAADADDLGLGAGVGDHGSERDGETGEAGDGGEPRDRGTERDARVGKVLAGPVERRVEERPELRRLAGRASQCAIEEIEDAEGEHQDARDEPQLGGRGRRSDGRPDEPDHGDAVRREADAPHAERDGHRETADPVPGPGGHEGLVGRALGHAPGSARRGAPMPSTSRWRSATAWKASGRSVQRTSRPLRRVSTRPAARRRPRCQLTSGCERPTCSMSSVTDRAAASESLDDAQPVDVGECLVEDPELTKLVGLVHDGGDGRTDARG